MSVIPLRPPAAWFADPEFTAPTPMRVEPTGRIRGHAASWGQCHTGIPGECRTPPHSEHDYGYFLTGEILTAEGTYQPVGQITLDTTHADLALDWVAAKRHMEVTGLAAADVNVGEDSYGIWMAGALRPNVTEDQIRELRASAVSGHWCPIGGSLELVGLLAANCQGFPQLRVSARGTDTRVLAASGLGVVELPDSTRRARLIAGHALITYLTRRST